MLSVFDIHTQVDIKIKTNSFNKLNKNCFFDSNYPSEVFYNKKNKSKIINVNVFDSSEYYLINFKQLDENYFGAVYLRTIISNDYVPLSFTHSNLIYLKDTSHFIFFRYQTNNSNQVILKSIIETSLSFQINNLLIFDNTNFLITRQNDSIMEVKPFKNIFIDFSLNDFKEFNFEKLKKDNITTKSTLIQIQNLSVFESLLHFNLIDYLGSITN